MCKKAIGKFMLKKLGWKIITPPEEPEKSVICVAPHTSNYDFFIGKFYYWAIGRKAGFLMKKEWFFFPLGLILKAMGGVPINRKKSKHGENKKGSTVSELQSYFRKPGPRHIAITPEGTRSATDRWKTGFLRIADGAKVPIQLAVMDYSKKEVGIFEIFKPTGNIEKDLAYVSSKYSAEQAYNPRKFTQNKPR